MKKSIRLRPTLFNWGMILLFLCVLIESSSLFLGLNTHTPHISTILYVISGVLIGIVPLLYPPIRTLIYPHPFYMKRVIHILCWGGFLFIVCYTLFIGKGILSEFPIDKRRADMLPVIKVMCQRFLVGDPIYAPIPEIWGIKPIYLPCLWGPFVPFEWMNWDIRYGTILGLLGGLLIIMLIIPGQKSPQSYTYLIIFIPCALIFHVIWSEKIPLIRFTQEGIVILFYLFLGYSLSKKNPWLIGIALGICLLSRYSLICWVPVYLFAIIKFRSFRFLFVVIITITALIFVMLIVPFGWDIVSYFMELPSKYPEMARRIWIKTPSHFIRNLGLAKYFSHDWVNFQHQLHIAVTAITPWLVLIFSWKWLKNGRITFPLWAICSLKITLVIFYNFIIVPIYYLFVVSSLFSILLLTYYIRQTYLGGN